MDGFVTPSGVAFDIGTFAREMFERGDRRGHVSGLTGMRTRAVRRMQGERAQLSQYRQRVEEQPREQRRAMKEVLARQPAPETMMRQRPDGSTVVMLPPGMTPRQSMRSLDR